MKLIKLLLSVLTVTILFCCGDPNVASKSLQPGDSIFVDKSLSLQVYGRLHRTSSSPTNSDGRYQVDSSKMEQSYTDIGKKFFYNREHTFIGTFAGISEYGEEYLIINLAPDIKEIILENKDLFGEKIKVDKKMYYSNEIGKNKILENFPQEIYIENNGINSQSADSIFDVLKD